MNHLAPVLVASLVSFSAGYLLRPMGTAASARDDRAAEELRAASAHRWMREHQYALYGDLWFHEPTKAPPGMRATGFTLSPVETPFGQVPAAVIDYVDDSKDGTVKSGVTGSERTVR
jgi:hypothetical protein